jgi:hypothetical protein
MGMGTFLMRAVSAATVVSLTAACLAQPANDECATATVAMIGAQMGTNVGATQSATLVNVPTNTFCNQATWATGAPNNQKDVFWSLTAPATADYNIDTCGSSFDTILSVHTGCPVTQTNMIACNDDSTVGTGNTACTNTLNSHLPHVTLTAGATYYIRIFGYSNATGSITLNINYVSTVGSCCNASTCVITDAANCTSTYADGGTCTPNPCAGACCHPANSRCSLVAQSSCPAGDNFLGVGMVCSPNPCTQASAGVCCRGSTCNTTVSTANCLGNGLAGAVHTASGSVCNSGGSTTTPCCFPDYNKTGGITVGDIFDFLNDWFAASPYANFGGDGSPATLAVQNIFDFLNAWFAGGC